MLQPVFANTSVAAHLLAQAPHIHRQGQLDVRIARSEEEIAAAQALRYRIFYDEMGAQPTLAMQAVRRQIGRDAPPQQADGGGVAVLGRHAAAPEL
jgi:putative hemolysin